MRRFTIRDLNATGILGARRAQVGHGSTLHLSATATPHESFVGVVVRPTGRREFWSWQAGQRFTCELVDSASAPRRTHGYSLMRERNQAAMRQGMELS